MKKDNIDNIILSIKIIINFLLSTCWIYIPVSLWDYAKNWIEADIIYLVTMIIMFVVYMLLYLIPHKIKKENKSKYWGVVKIEYIFVIVYLVIIHFGIILDGEI